MLYEVITNPEGEGRVPNITPGGENISTWSAADIAYYLESGFTPEFDTVGGSMVAVQENMAKLGAEDRAAIAAYLKALPARDRITSYNVCYTKLLRAIPVSGITISHP